MIITGNGRGAMSRAWVCQSRGIVFDSRRIAVVSGRASQLNSNALVPHKHTSLRPVLILGINKKNQVTSSILTEFHRISRL